MELKDNFMPPTGLGHRLIYLRAVADFDLDKRVRLAAFAFLALETERPAKFFRRRSGQRRRAQAYRADHEMPLRGLGIGQQLRLLSERFPGATRS
jgi:hypothetical protein